MIQVRDMVPEETIGNCAGCGQQTVSRHFGDPKYHVACAACTAATDKQYAGCKSFAFFRDMPIVDHRLAMKKSLPSFPSLARKRWENDRRVIAWIALKSEDRAERTEFTTAHSWHTDVNGWRSEAEAWAAEIEKVLNQ